MKLYTAILSVAAAAFLSPSICMAEDQTPPPPPDSAKHMHGPGGAKEPMTVTPEIQKLLSDYKATPSDDLKAQIKTKLGEAFDKYVKDEKERLDKLQANRDKELDTRLEKLLSGKQEEFKGRPKHKQE